jgi:hypothetical protein
VKKNMNSQERLDTVIGLATPDRVPVALVIDAFAARHGGISMEEWLFNPDKARAALDKTVEDLGGCDGLLDPAPTHPDWLTLSWPMRLLLPGRELPPNSLWQLNEGAIMTAEDYDTIIEKGIAAFWAEFWPRLGKDPAQLPAIRQEMMARWKVEVDRWQARGVIILRGAGLRLPFDTFAYARSLHDFSLDLYRRPQKVIQAQESALEGTIQLAKDMAAFSGSRIVFLSSNRASATFLRPQQFEQFYLPWLKRAVNALVKEGLTPFLHFDNDWTAFLPYLRELPRARCFLHLDGSTDLTKAKELLGDHMCLMGDVPAALLTLGTRQEVADYCKRLIDTVGAGGGFILSAGCTVPGDAPFENVRALVETAHTYGRYN